MTVKRDFKRTNIAKKTLVADIAVQILKIYCENLINCAKAQGMKDSFAVINGAFNGEEPPPEYSFSIEGIVIIAARASNKLRELGLYPSEEVLQSLDTNIITP